MVISAKRRTEQITRVSLLDRVELCLFRVAAIFDVLNLEQVCVIFLEQDMQIPSVPLKRLPFFGEAGAVKVESRGGRGELP